MFKVLNKGICVSQQECGIRRNQKDSLPGLAICLSRDITWWYVPHITPCYLGSPKMWTLIKQTQHCSSGLMHIMSNSIIFFLEMELILFTLKTLS